MIYVYIYIYTRTTYSPCPMDGIQHMDSGDVDLQPPCRGHGPDLVPDLSLMGHGLNQET